MLHHGCSPITHFLWAHWNDSDNSLRIVFVSLDGRPGQVFDFNAFTPPKKFMNSLSYPFDTLQYLDYIFNKLSNA